MDDGNAVTFIRCYCELILFGNFERKKEKLLSIVSGRVLDSLQSRCILICNKSPHEWPW